MGRRYSTELEELEDTYAWAMRAEIKSLGHAVETGAHLPLTAVGSGGSLTTCRLLVHFHRVVAGAIAQTSTPMQIPSVLPADGRVAAWLLTAGGRNVDIRGALRAVVEAEPRKAVLLCGAPTSPIVEEASKRSWVEEVSFDLPVRDGFLATNSVLAFGTLLARAYGKLGGHGALPATLDRLLDGACPMHRQLVERTAHLWAASTLIVLHGEATAAAAVDVESRFTEAALGAVQLADFRNFAHGRHHWLAKHGHDTAVLAFVAPEDASVARATLATLPEGTALAEIPFEGALADVALAAIVISLRLAGLAGTARKIDPGRPGVPPFGRRLYHQKPVRGLRAPKPHLSKAASAAIVRKTRCAVSSLEARGQLAGWVQALASYQAALGDITFAGIVLDYDGTIVEGPERGAGPTPAVVGGLRRLLDRGIPIGIATGRGGSVCEALRAALPKRQWDRVTVGFHNGAIVQPLSAEVRLSDLPPDEALSRAAAAIEKETLLHGIARTRARPRQITVYPTPHTAEDQLWLLVSECLRREGLDGLRVVRSSHSVDVLPPSSSKLRVVEAVKQQTASQDVLAIGDRGCWPGNDYEILATQNGLSVDEVSPDPTAAWNVAPPGNRGVGALLYYLDRCKPGRRGFRFVREDE